MTFKVGDEIEVDLSFAGLLGEKQRGKIINLDYKLIRWSPFFSKFNGQPLLEFEDSLHRTYWAPFEFCIKIKKEPQSLLEKELAAYAEDPTRRRTNENLAKIFRG